MTEEIFGKILNEYDALQSEVAAARQRRMSFTYEKAPRVKEIDAEINRLGCQNVLNIMQNPAEGAKYNAELKARLAELEAEKAAVLVKSGLSPDYDKYEYKCSLCSDTGYLPGGERCSCFEKKLIEEAYRRSAFGELIKNNGFDDFSPEYYPDKQYPEVERTARENIEEIIEYCKEYCKNFDNETHSLMFFGKTGLGKTLLSSIIAKLLTDSGKSVVYARATRVFSEYENYKFRDYSIKPQIDLLYDADLLILDDLGSELITKTGVAFLFDLINERTAAGKKMLISTNLEPKELSKSYSARFTSRLYESFRIFRFVGEDVRIQKMAAQQRKD